MRIIADFHFHSRFSRACSPDLTIPNLDKMAAFKGVHILGTGDFTHPEWMAEIKKCLEPAEEGLYQAKNSPSPSLLSRGISGVRFVLTCEISSIYSTPALSGTKKTRRVHTVFVMPSIESAEKFTAALVKKGANVRSDGRPIVGIPAMELAKIALDVDPRCMVVPAHIWTPWFAMFGSMSGFDSVEECFGDVAKRIFAVEMGMSSDAAMNWRVSNLDRFALLASSDAHSLRRIAREGNVFELSKGEKLSYDWVYNVIKEKNPEKFLYTVKYYPQEGRYHYDGHADCGFSCKPDKTKKLKGICPKCNRKLTVGVLSRVDELADRPDFAGAASDKPEGYAPPGKIPTRHLVPFEEVVADCYGMGVQSKKVREEYERIVGQAGGEYQVLLDMPYAELAKIAAPIIVEGIKRNREEKLHIEPGYDGKYGRVQIFTEEERVRFGGKKKQEALF